MTGTPGPQTLDSIVAFWICVPLGALFLILGIIAVARIRKADDAVLPISGAVGSFILVACLFGGYIVGMYPDDFVHHHFTRYTGTVAQISSRFVASGSDGGGPDQKFVVAFVEAPTEQYGVIDTRAALVKPGQQLTIDCVKQWQQAGTEGQDCQFVSVQ